MIICNFSNLTKSSSFCVLFGCFHDLAHLHFLFSTLLEFSDLFAHLYLLVEVLILVLGILFELLFVNMHVFSGLFSHFFECLFLIDISTPEIYGLVFLPKLFLYLLFIAKLFHAISILEEMLWELADDFQPFLWTDIVVIKQFKNRQAFYDVSLIVCVLG